MTGVSRVAEKAPSRGGAAALVLATADNAASNCADLARAVGTDPGLTTRVLALANSGYYGLSRRIASTEFAISIIGFDVVRSLALAQATRLDRADLVPPGFWQHAALCAAASAAIAPTFGAPKPEAFCVGLLHTIGSALLNQQAPLPALCSPEPDDLAAFLTEERERYGTDHVECGAQTLEQWNFPAEICDVIAQHHDDVLPNANPLTRVLRMSRLLVDLIVEPVDEPTVAHRELERLSQGRIGAPSSATDLPILLGQIADRSTALYQGLAC